MGIEISHNLAWHFFRHNIREQDIIDQVSEMVRDMASKRPTYADFVSNNVLDSKART